jgi:hypothetical protein
MSNGAVARLPLLVHPKAAKPDAAPAKTELEIKIGEATAAACTALCKSIEEYSEGRITSATKLASAERIARLAHIELDNFGELDSFADVARRQGKIHLRKILDNDPEFRLHHGPHTGDATISSIISEVLLIVGKVVALERAIRRAS